jgi:hypothetical protein
MTTSVNSSSASRPVSLQSEVDGHYEISQSRNIWRDNVAITQSVTYHDNSADNFPSRQMHVSRGEIIEVIRYFRAIRNDLEKEIYNPYIPGNINRSKGATQVTLNDKTYTLHLSSSREQSYFTVEYSQKGHQSRSSVVDFNTSGVDYKGVIPFNATKINGGFGTEQYQGY